MTSENQSYWHVLLPEERRVIRMVADGVVLDEPDSAMLQGLAKRIAEEALDQELPDVKMAREMMMDEASDEEDMEVDDNSTVTRTESGYWVQAWFWVEKEDVELNMNNEGVH